MKKSEKPAERVRILCLHGYRQNGDTFRAKIGSVRKHLFKYAEFVFITAPHDVRIPEDEVPEPALPLSSEDSSSETEERGGKSWWFNSDDQTFKGTNRNGPAFGFDTSLAMVEEAWRVHGPFHGLMGFSQGGCFAGLICSLAARAMTSVKPKFVIIASGFRSGSLAHANYYEDVISIPSLHIYGSGDTIISHRMSKSLADCFEDATIIQHAGGHYFAATAVQRPTYTDFLRAQLVHHLEQRELNSSSAVIVDGIEPSTSQPSQSSDSD